MSDIDYCLDPPMSVTQRERIFFNPIAFSRARDELSALRSRLAALEAENERMAKILDYLDNLSNTGSGSRMYVGRAMEEAEAAALNRDAPDAAE
jgi:hypothetical protein